MLLFLIGFTAVIFGIAYLFQILGWMLIGLELVAIMLLFLSFWESKKGKYWRIIGMNVIMVIFVVTLYFSEHVFTYIQHHDVEKMLVIVVGFLLAQLLGIFWGRQFYKQETKKYNRKKG